MFYFFFLEMLIKLVGLKPKGYFMDKFNAFDCLIIIFSLIELLINYIEDNQDSTKGILTAFRGLRLLRVFKIARQWKGFKELLIKIIKTLKSIS